MYLVPQAGTSGCSQQKPLAASLPSLSSFSFSHTQSDAHLFGTLIASWCSDTSLVFSSLRLSSQQYLSQALEMTLCRTHTWLVVSHSDSEGSPCVPGKYSWKTQLFCWTRHFDQSTEPTFSWPSQMLILYSSLVSVFLYNGTSPTCKFSPFDYLVR